MVIHVCAGRFDRVAKRARGRDGRYGRNLADLSSRPEDDGFIPYREDTRFREFSVALNLDRDRLVVREWRDQQSGALSDFVISQQTFDPESRSWKDVALIDAKHGNVHIHRYRKSGSEISRTVINSYLTREELENEYKRVHNQLFDSWEESRRRWAAGR